jgi:Protein of unknown function (DUF3592)
MPADPRQAVPRSNPGWRGWVTALAWIFALFTGLCTLFALVVTTGQAWEEHTHAQWPEVTAQVQRCGLDIYTHFHGTAYWINCSLSYQVRSEEFVSQVHSASTPDPRRVLGKNPSAAFDRMQAWVDAHPEGTSIRVHYNPANHANTALVETDMPGGGLRTPDNLKLLGFFAVSCIVMLTIARIAKPRFLAVKG